jgi:hypothetical protein
MEGLDMEGLPLEFERPAACPPAMMGSTTALRAVQFSAPSLPELREFLERGFGK